MTATEVPLLPIETLYAGHRFRSRLEARWAVFLDHFQLGWEYESEGFALPSGWYLPDFRIKFPSNDRPVWLEVKGQRPRLHETALTMELAVATGCTVLVAHGQIPWDGVGDGMYLFKPPDRIWTDCHWRRTRERGLFVEARHPGGEPVPLDPAIRTAFQRARSARFEFGEAGYSHSAA